MRPVHVEKLTEVIDAKERRVVNGQIGKLIYIKDAKCIKNKVEERIKNFELNLEKLRSKENNRNNLNNVH